MARTCATCDECVSISETKPFGQCFFFSTGARNVNILKDTCPNHSEERREEEELLENYYSTRRS